MRWAQAGRRADLLHLGQRGGGGGPPVGFDPETTVDARLVLLWARTCSPPRITTGISSRKRAGGMEPG